MLKVIRYFIAYTWELPQTIFSLFCILFLKAKKIGYYKTSVIWEVDNSFLTNWSLGLYIFDNKSFKLNDYALKHEYGHSLQSFIIGPLFILLVGIPSSLWNLLSRKWEWFSKTYYKTPWEWTADRLGGVINR